MRRKRRLMLREACSFARFVERSQRRLYQQMQKAKAKWSPGMDEPFAFIDGRRIKIKDWGKM